MQQPQRDSLFDKCRCGRNKHANRDKCYKCHAKWRYHNDPKYKESKNSRSRKDEMSLECPRCGEPMLMSSKLCNACAQTSLKVEGPAAPQLSFEDCAMIYSYRNPDDPIDGRRAKTIFQIAIAKIRKAIAEEGTHEDLIAATRGLEELIDG